MTDNDLRAALTEITDDVCGTTVLQIADRLKSLHNKILADHARTLLKEAFPQYQTAVFVRYWDEKSPSLLHLLSKTEPQLDYYDDVQRQALDELRQEALRTAERCIIYLGTDEEVSDLLPTENQHEDYVEFDLDLDDPGAIAEDLPIATAANAPAPANINEASSSWTRPSDFEDRAQERAETVMDENELEPTEAFLSGALWAALVAEGRLTLDDESYED